MYKLSKLKKAIVASTLITVLPSTGYSQLLIEEIIVTAQKKSQGLQEVGVSVTAFTEQQLNALGWDNSLDVAAQTPGLITTSNTGDSANVALFSIRGVSQPDFAEGQEAPVALYRDEAYVSSPGASGVPFFDTERIEVLRGPQGTLYGRNATGGLVHFISNKPTKEFEGSLQLSDGEFGQLGMETVLSGALSKDIQGRIALYYNRDDGYIENLIGDNKRADNTQSIRGSVNFDFSDKSNLLVIGQYTDIETRGGVFHTRASKINASGESVFCNAGDTDCGTYTANLPVGQNGFFSEGALFDVANGQIDDGDGSVHRGSFDRNDSGVDRDSTNLTAIFKTAFNNGIEFTSVTDFSQSDKVYAEDDDSTKFAVVTYDATAKVDQFSQEVRFSGNSGSIDWVAGIYYLTIDNLFTGAFAFPSDGYFPRFEGDSMTDTISAFGQIDYRFADDFLLTAGLRLTQDNKDIVYTMLDCDVTSSLADEFCPARLISDPVRAEAGDPTGDALDGLLADGFPHPFERKDSEISGKIQLDWQVTDDNLLYAGISRGVKGGGFNTPTDGFDTADIAFVGFDPEILHAFEIGTKNIIANGRAKFNGSIFYYDYDNFQAFFFADTTSRLINSKAEYFGAEFELAWSPVDGLDLLAGISFLDTNVNGSSPGGTEIIDQEAPLAPDFSANLLVRKEWQFANDATFAIQGSMNYVGEQFFNIINTEVTTGGDYTLLDVNFTYITPKEDLEFSLYINNITDEEALTYSYDITGFGNYTIQTFGPPSWFGVKAKYHF